MIKNIIFPLFSIVAGGLATYQFFADQNYFALINACLALFAFTLFLARASFYKFCLFIWILLQVASVNLATNTAVGIDKLGPQSATMLSTVDFCQYFSYVHEAVPQVEIAGNSATFNLLPAVYLLVFLMTMGTSKKKRKAVKHVKRSATRRKSNGRVAGQIFDLRLFRFNDMMEQILPQRVKVVGEIDFADSRDWLLVKLSKPVKFKGGKVIKAAVIKNREEGSLIRGIKGQMAHFRLISNVNVLKSHHKDLSKTTFIDWVLVR